MNQYTNPASVPEISDNTLLLHMAYIALFNIRYGFARDVNETCDIVMKALKKEMDKKHE